MYDTILFLLSALACRVDFLIILFAVCFAQRSKIERFAELHQKENLSLVLNNFFREGGWMGPWIGWVSIRSNLQDGETWEIIIICYIIHNRIIDTIINFIVNDMS